MFLTLTPDILPIDRTLAAVVPQWRATALRLHRDKQVAVVALDSQTARLTVAETPENALHVTVQITGQQLIASCTCPNRHSYTCIHRLAAMLQLRDHLLAHPPSVWRMVLDRAVTTPRRASPVASDRLIFSLFQRANLWIIVPYSLRLRGELAAADQTAALLADDDRLFELAKPIRQRVSAAAFPAERPETIAAANMALMLAASPGYGYATYYSTPGFYEPVLGLLPGALVYYGAELRPFQQRINVLAEPVDLALDLRMRDESLQMRAHLARGDQTLDLVSAQARVVVADPLWLLVGDVLLPVRDGGVGAALLSYPELTVPADEQTEFLERYLLPLAEHLPVQGDDVTWETIEVAPQPRIYLREAGGELVAELRFDYAGFELQATRVVPPVSTQRRPNSLQLARVRRDEVAESEAGRLVLQHGLKRTTDAGQFQLKKSTNALDFLAREVPRLTSSGFEIYGEANLSQIRINRTKPTMRMNVASGIDWFDVEATLLFGDATAPLAEVRRAMKRGDQYVKLSDGSLGAIPEEWLARYRRLFALGEEQDGVVRLGEAQGALLDQLLGEADEAQADAEFGRRRERLRTLGAVTARELPPGFVGELRPYQKAGYDWMHFLRDAGFGGCLADDMGLGKTIQTLAFLESLYHTDPEAPASLIVMPRSLLFNWQREAERFAPGLAVCIHVDRGRVREVEKFDEYDLVLTTYGTMRRDSELLRSYTWHTIILDESQVIKNPVSETARNARLLRGTQRLALTGTPVENSSIDLWSQFAFLNPGLLGNLDRFREEFAGPIERGESGEARDLLRRMVYPFLLRRTKEQVAPELPARTEQVVVCEMEPNQKRLYIKRRDEYRAALLGTIDSTGMNDARMQVLEGLLRLRQICCHPLLVDAEHRGGSGKFEALLETVATLQAEGRRALVFSQFTELLKLVRAELDTRKIPYAYLDGRTRNRQQIVERFQAGDGPPFFLISLKAGGVGLNLTAADHVLLLDPWWNPAVEQQAIDRTHRIGQDRPVFVQRFVTRDSVEEKIMALQGRKRELAEQLVAAEASGFKSLTRDDIEVLFS